MVNSKDIFNVHWPNSLGLIEGFLTMIELKNISDDGRMRKQNYTTDELITKKKKYELTINQKKWRPVNYTTQKNTEFTSIQQKCLVKT